MNKITSILAGIATVAAVSVAPAFAQGNLFSPPGTFSFVTSMGGVTVTGSGETFNPTAVGASPITPVSFTLTGTAVTGFPTFYNLTNLTITGTGVGSGATPNTFVETGALQFSIQTTPAGGTTIASSGPAADGTTFNLVSAPVPEASTTISFGALLALGGLALVLRRKGVKNAA